MNKYINTEQIEQYLHREEHGTPDERWRPESEFAEIIDRIPAADVAEVVRCKDCKYRAKGILLMQICAYFGETDFCSKGERKENV